MKLHNVVKHAAYGGHLNCVGYLIENGCLWDVHTVRWTMLGKSPKCLKCLNI